MDRRDFAYFLTVSNVTPSEVAKISDLLKNEEFFDGHMSSYGDLNSEPYTFDTDAVGGTVTVIDRDLIDNAMHVLATSFPNAEFYLQAEDVDDKSVAYEIKTCGDMYQSAELRSYMPALSPPVPYEARYHQPARQDYAEKILSGTDFQLLHQQKLALGNCAYNGIPIPVETLEGLLNFLDVIEDWAEQEGKFTFPEHQEVEKPSLNSQIAAAAARSNASADPKNFPSKEEKTNLTPIR